MLLLTVFSFFVPPSTWQYHVGKPNVSARAVGDCRIHFLDVGQGDCAIVELPDGKIALIDGGDGSKEHTRYILRYMNALKIKTVDYLVATHSDTDHVGSLSRVLEVKGAVETFMPYLTRTMGAAYESFVSAAKEHSQKRTFSRRGLSRSVRSGETPYEFNFLSPLSPDTPNSEYSIVNADANADDTAINDTSAVVYLEYAGRKVLFLGDVSAEKERAILRDCKVGLVCCDGKFSSLDNTDILKVSHHGSAFSSDETFITALGVKEAIFSVGKSNPYFHPSPSVLSVFSRVGASIHRTDEKGTIVVTISSDGSYRIA